MGWVPGKAFKSNLTKLNQDHKKLNSLNTHIRTWLILTHYSQNQRFFYNRNFIMDTNKLYKIDESEAYLINIFQVLSQVFFPLIQGLANRSKVNLSSIYI